MTNTIVFSEITHSVLPCIFNNLITILILYQFMKTFLGYKPDCRKTAAVLYVLFFVFENILSFNFELYILLSVPYFMDKYLNFILYTILIFLIIFIAFCYKPTISTGLSSAALTALSLYCSVPIANYIFDALYQFIVPNFDIFNSFTPYRHIFYVIFEEYQQIFIYILEIMIKLLFLFAVLRVKHIYDERNMYHMQASRQQKNNLELKQFRHDIKNHMGALNQMLTSNEEDKARAYLSKMNGIADATQLYSHTGNVALDSIVNYKLTKAKNSQIQCNFSTSIPEHLNLRDEDIVIILGNLLDNAIEACMKLENNRYININMTYWNGLLIIRISNSYNGTIKKSGRKLATLKTNKSMHGLGLKNVRYALSHYNGTLEINTEDMKFTVSAIIYVMS